MKYHAATWPEPVIVISPHLDDAALSLGATIAMLSRHGVTPRVVTVMANDPDSDEVAQRFDLECGFASARDAARGRRAEDARACAVLGAEPVWLPLSDREHTPPVDDETLREALRACVAEGGTVLVPGFPLLNVDHARVARAAAHPEVIGSRRLGLYLEQPYAAGQLAHRSAPDTRTRSRVRKVYNFAMLAAVTGRRAVSGLEVPAVLRASVDTPAVWESPRTTLTDRLRKQQAIGAYRSQVRPLGPAVRTRIAFSELATRGERIAWTRPAS